MKRLTYAGDYCEDIAMCGKGPSRCGPKGCRNKQLWDRLKAYEDTGLSPEEVQALIRMPSEENVGISADCEVGNQKSTALPGGAEQQYFKE